MEKCPRLEMCSMFKLFRHEATKTIFIRQYCEGDFKKCIRKQKKDTGREVPDNLMPNGEYLDAD